MNTPSCLVLPVHKAVVAVVTESCVFGKYRHVCVHTALQGVHHSVHQLKCLLVSIRSEVDYVQMQSAMSTLGNVGKMLSCPVQTNLHAALPLLIHSFQFFCQDQFQLGYIQMQSAVCPSKSIFGNLGKACPVLTRLYAALHSLTHLLSMLISQNWVRTGSQLGFIQMLSAVPKLVYLGQSSEDSVMLCADEATWCVAGAQRCFGLAPAKCTAVEQPAEAELCCVPQPEHGQQVCGGRR